MGFYEQIKKLIQDESTRSPYPYVPSVEMFLDTWARGDYVICFDRTEDCPRYDVQTVHLCFHAILGFMFANLHCDGWWPHEFHTICNKINLILDGRALVSVGQKWAFDDDEHWESARKTVEANIRNVLRGTSYE